MIKKILLFLVMTWVMLPASVFSVWGECQSGSCNIYSAPAPALTQYLQDIKTVLWNTQKTQNQTNISNISWRLSSWYANILSFDGYFGSFDYFVVFPLFQDVPAQIERDYAAIEQVNSHIKLLLKRATLNARVDVCEGIDHCNIPAGSQRATLLALLRNNNTILQFYRQSVMWKRLPRNINSITLVSNDFISQIQEHYNPTTLQECSACKEWYASRLREKIKNIVSLNAQWKEWILEWKAAIDLITWNISKERYAMRERELLDQYLSETWVPFGQAERVLWNLDRFNAWWLSSSNPLQNSFHYSRDKWIEQLNSFVEFVKENGDKKSSVPIADFAVQTQDIKNTSQIENEISKMYADLLPLAYVSDNDSMAIQSRIIKMHSSLTETTNTFRSLKKRSERLCEKQWIWLGRCSYTSQ